MNNTNDLYNRWLAQPDLDDAVKAELVSIAGDADAVTDRFYRDLEFGTGGLRGVIGAGTNRMNLYTVRKATQGLADYLNASGLPKKVAIAHDSRHNGALFARETARVLAANGITACMYPRLEPTPLSTTATRSTARTAARSRWRLPRKFWQLSKKLIALTMSGWQILTLPPPRAAL